MTDQYHSFPARWIAPLLLGAATAGTLHATTFHVSPSGSDTANTGLTLASPFATIQKAANLMAPGDTCLIRAGTYRESVNVPVSGTAQAPITFQAYNGETVTLSGADPITTGWTQESTNVWYVPITGSLGASNQVFQNGAMKPEARWPNVDDSDGTVYPWQNSQLAHPTRNELGDWSYVNSASYSSVSSFTDAQLPPRSNGYWNGTKLRIMSGDGWIMRNLSVTGYTESTKTIVTNDTEVSPGGAYTIKAGNEFFLTGKKEELDSPGEWFWDASNNRLYFHSVGAPVGVEVKKRPTGINLSGRSFIHLLDLGFFACTIQTSPAPSMTTDCTFDGLSMQYLNHHADAQQTYGLTLGTRCVLRNSELSFCSGTLVFLRGSDIRLFNNDLRDMSYFPSFTEGIASSNFGGDENATNRCLISHNTIHRSGRALIGYPGREPIIQFNDVYDAMRLTSDGALLYWANDGANGIVRYNLIHDAVGAVGHTGAGVKGLYFDNQNSGWIAHHNIIWNISGSAMHNNARNNFDMVFNNTFWNCAGGSVQSDFWSDGETGTRYYNNLFNGPPLGNSDNWARTDVRFNLTTNPLLVDPANGNFQLQSSSPAINSGTVIPGVTDGFAGTKPDIGALESGMPDWTASAGHKATPPSPDPVYSMPVQTYANQIKNSSFETGVLAPDWAVSSGSNVGLVRSNSWYDPHLRSSFFGLQFGGGTSEVSQELSGLLPNKRYKLFCGVQKTDPAATVVIGVRSYGMPDVEFSVPTTGIWQQNSFVAPGGMFALPFVMGPEDSTATVYVRVTRTANSSVAPKNANGTFPTVAAALVNLSSYTSTETVNPMYPATGVYVDDLGVVLSQENNDPLPYRMPVVSYPFNETGGTSALDSGTNHKNATLTGATFAPGRQDNALTFTGMTQRANTGSIEVPTAGGSFSVAFWLKLNSVGAGEFPKPVDNAGWLKKGWHVTSDPNLSVAMYLWSKDNSLETDNPPTGMASFLSQPLAAGTWTHVAFTFDRENGVLRSYRDGVVNNTTAIPAGFGDINIPTGLKLGSGFSNGQMDDFQLWHYALAPREIAAAAAPDSTLALRYKCDENPGASKAWDASGNQRNATLTTADFAPSKTGSGNALTYSGANGSATTSASPQVPSAAGAGSFSVAYWLKLSAVGANPRIASTHAGTPPAKGWSMDFDNSSNLRLRLIDQSLTELTSPFSTGLTPGAWTHIVYTIDRANALVTRYRDGHMEGSTAIPPGFGAVDSAAALSLATDVTTGQVDDFRLYQRVLTWQEVVDIPLQFDASPYDSGVSNLSVVQTSGTSATLTWSDNSSDETGFRIERRTSTGGNYVTIGTVGPDTTLFTDSGPFNTGESYFYRIVVTGAEGDLATSAETAFTATAGALSFDGTHQKTDRTSGTVQIPVHRSSGVNGIVSVNYTTSDSSALAGTHYTQSSGTLTWADGETGTKSITVPLINDATPRQARQFHINLAGPGGGATLGSYQTKSVLIEDPAATLPSPWVQTVFNGDGSVLDSSPAAIAEGVLGSTTLGGSGLKTSTTQENGQFIHQTRTGDGVLTARVPTPVPAQTGARFAVMVRNSADRFSKMASTVTSGDGAFGAKFIHRSGSPAGSVLTGTALSHTTPSWIRIIRVGDIFTSQVSPDGVSWTTLGSLSITIASTAQWGVFHLSDPPAGTPPLLADYQLAVFENVTIEELPAPSAVDGLVSTLVRSSNITLQWNTTPLSQGYRIERRTEGGEFTLLADLVAYNTQPTQAYADTVQSDTAYEYRVVSYNSSGAALSSNTLVAITPHPEMQITRSTEDAGGADGTVFMGFPTLKFGTLTKLWSSGIEPFTFDDAEITKNYMRFDLSSVPGAIVRADLKLTFLTQRGFNETGFYYMATHLLASDAADVWDETNLTWSNAPLNQTNGRGVLAPSQQLGVVFYSSLAAFPPVGSQATIGLNAAAINNGIGANGIVTLVTYNEFDGAQADWASREHTVSAPPTLVIDYANPLPTRPGFLTATAGAGSAVQLAWTETASGETGFEIQRRMVGADWTSLATVAANSTGYADGTSISGVYYDYRIRTVSASGLSSWASLAVMQARPHATVTGPAWQDGVNSPQSESLPGAASVPTGFTYRTPALDLVPPQSLSASLLNNVSGWVGMKLTVGSKPVTVLELGRWIAPGNTSPHPMKLVVASTSADVPGSSVTVTTSGEPAGLKYVPLAAPLTLAANTIYYLVSQETNGGDSWYRSVSTLTHATSVAQFSNTVTSTDGTTYLSGFQFIPVSFRYATVAEPAPFITGHEMSAVRNDISGWFGMALSTGSEPMVIDKLGRWVIPGNTGTHSVKLINATTGATLATASIATAGATPNQFKYTSLAAPVTLTANTSYYLLSEETAGGDQWYDFSTPAPGGTTGYQQWLLANGLPMDASENGAATATPNQDGVPNLIKYALGLSPETNGNGGHLGYGSVNEGGNDYLTFTYIRPEPAPTDITYSVQASSDLSAGSWSGSGLTEIGSTVNAGLRTITIRDVVPIFEAGSRFMRLEVTQP